MCGQRHWHPHDGRDKKVGAPWQHPTLSPLFTIGQSALTVAGDWSAGTGHTRPGHCLLCVDLWQTPTLIGGILTQLSTPRHCTGQVDWLATAELSLAAETKRDTWSWGHTWHVTWTCGNNVDTAICQHLTGKHLDITQYKIQSLSFARREERLCWHGPCLRSVPIKVISEVIDGMEHKAGELIGRIQVSYWPSLCWYLLE